MFKKSLLALVILGFILSSADLVSQTSNGKANVIEHLVFAQSSVRHDLSNYPAYQYSPTDPYSNEQFLSPTLLTFHVPPSPKSDTLFFELFTRGTVTYANTESRIAGLQVMIRFVSDSIPDNFTIYSGHQVIKRYGDVAVASGTMGVESGLHTRTTRLIMRNNTTDWWIITSDTGEDVPKEIALPLLDKLIKEGFDVEVYATGQVLGVSLIRCDLVLIDVTRLSKHEFY